MDQRGPEVADGPAAGWRRISERSRQTCQAMTAKTFALARAQDDAVALPAK